MSRRILVITGGTSNERAVALRSGANIITALRLAGYDVSVADPADAGFNLPELTANIDVVFPVLHGIGGEDGVLQRQLEDLGLPFVGSGSVASELAFHKARYKQHISENGLLTPRWEVVDRQSFRESDLANQPYVLKPISGGSSIHTHIIYEPSAQRPSYELEFELYGQLLLEELIIGQEITVSVLDDVALPVIHIIPPSGEMFDYENKYNGKTQELLNSAAIPRNLQRTAQQIARTIHTLIDLRHLSRTDMIITEDGKIYILETNTIPGLTDQSLFPKASLASGLTHAQLVRQLVEASYAEIRQNSLQKEENRA